MLALRGPSAWGNLSCSESITRQGFTKRRRCVASGVCRDASRAVLAENGCEALRGRAARPSSLGELALPIQNRLSIGLKRLTIRLLLVEPLTLNDQDLERLLNRLDGETRLPSTTGRSFPLSHEEPPAALALSTGRKVSLGAAGIPMLKCRIAPSRERVVRTRYRTRLAAAVSRFAAVAALTTIAYVLGTVPRGEAGHPTESWRPT
jgi:hypothetical protein